MAAFQNSYNTTLTKYLKNETENNIEFIDLSKELWLNDTYFDITSRKLVNKMNSGSRTYVISIDGQILSKYQEDTFIVKYTPILDNIDLQKSDNECLIYKYIRNLVKDNICPFIYYAFQCKYLENTTDDEKQILNIYELFKFKNIYMSILKTNNVSQKSYTLFDFLNHNQIFSKDLFIILFQIMYTLKCFQLIGLKHNDLHLRNIIIEEENNPITESYNKYIVGYKTYIIPKTRYTVKIFDFDLSAIFNRNDNIKLKDEYKSNLEGFIHINYLKEYNNTYLNNEDNIMFDVLKLIYGLNKYNFLYPLLNMFFNNQDMCTVINAQTKILSKDIETENKDLLKRIVNSNTKTEDELDDIKSYAELNVITNNNYPFDSFGNFKDATFGDIKVIDEILDIIYAQIQSSLPVNPTISETYNLNNLNKPIASKPLCFTSKPFVSSFTSQLPPSISVGGYILKNKKSIKHKSKKNKLNYKSKKNKKSMKHKSKKNL